MSKDVLLISDHPDDPAFLAEVAQVNRAQVHTAPDPERAIDKLEGHNFSAIFVDVSKVSRLRNLEMEVQKRYGLLGEQVQASRMHFISDKPLSEKRDVIQSPFFGSFFQRPASDVEESGKYYGRILSAGEERGANFLVRLLGEEGDVQEVSLERSAQKQEAAEAVRNYLIQGRVPARIANTLTNVVDELLMNAIYDAPGDEFGRPLYSITSRDEDRQLSGRETVEMKIGFDGLYLGVSVSDHFGSLDRTRLLNHVSINYRDQEYKLRQGGAGAGLGLASILNTGGSLLYHCEDGRRTEAILVSKVFESYRDFRAQFRFFSARFYG
jgi:hypothetical protein